VETKRGATSALAMVAKIGKRMIHGALEERSLGMSGTKKTLIGALAALGQVGGSPHGMVGLTTQNLVLQSPGMTKLEVSHLHGMTNPTVSLVMTGLMTRLMTNHMKNHMRSHMTGLERKIEGGLLQAEEVGGMKKKVLAPYWFLASAVFGWTGEIWSVLLVLLAVLKVQ